MHVPAIYGLPLPLSKIRNTNGSLSSKHPACVNSCNPHNRIMKSQVNFTLQLKTPRHRERGNLLKFIQPGEKFPLSWLEGPLAQKGLFAQVLGSTCLCGARLGRHCGTHSSPFSQCECAFQDHTAPLSLTFPPMAASPVAWPAGSLVQTI